MANIGTFTADKDGYTGQLRTLTLNVKVKLVSNDKGDSENAPDFRVQAAGHDIGAAWKKTSEAGRPYVSVTLDDPSFPATVYARLIENEDGMHDPHLVAQQTQGGLTTAHRAPPIAGRRAGAARHARAYGASRSSRPPQAPGAPAPGAARLLRGLSPA